MGTETGTETLSSRDRAILRAVAAGGAELFCGTCPELLLDGRCCSDQTAARRLALHGLIAAAPGCSRSASGDRVPALLTPAGEALLAA